VAVDPPVMPFTCQVTVLFVELATVAVNCVVAPSRVSAEPDTVTVMDGVVTPPPDELNVPEEHPAMARREEIDTFTRQEEQRRERIGAVGSATGGSPRGWAPQPERPAERIHDLCSALHDSFNLLSPNKLRIFETFFAEGRLYRFVELTSGRATSLSHLPVVRQP